MKNDQNVQELLSSLSPGIVHEMNNPLQMITIATDLLSSLLPEEVMADTTTQKTIGTIEKAAQKMASLTRGMRALSRDQWGDDPELYSLKEMLEDAQHLLGEFLRDHAIDLQVIWETEEDIRVSCVQGSATQEIIRGLVQAIHRLEGQSNKSLKLTISKQDSDLGISLEDTVLTEPTSLIKFPV